MSHDNGQLPPWWKQRPLRILFFSYWPVNETLTDSTLVPYFRMLQAMPSVERVDFVTIERAQGGRFKWSGLDKVVHTPVHTRWDALAPLSRWDTFRRGTEAMVRLCREHRVDVIDSKGAVAGIMAAKVSARTGIPFIVESFEPHADYMADSGVWSRFGPYYRYSKWQEQRVKREAAHLVTVTEGYRERLIEEGVLPQRISVVPSVTDLDMFRFSPEARSAMRRELRVEGPMGVYLGKFGGLYYEEEAYNVFLAMYERMGRGMHLLILTGSPADEVRVRLSAMGLPDHAVTIRHAEHKDVPAYLSAADMAFSTIRYLPHGKYQSPVKNGEYWASGLPILLTHGVSDDYRIIEREPAAGALFKPDLSDLGPAVDHMAALLRSPDRERVMDIAKRYRSMDIARDRYERLFGGRSNRA